MVERHVGGMRTWVGEGQGLNRPCEHLRKSGNTTATQSWMVGWLDGWSCLHINIKVPVNINNYRNIETDKVTLSYIYGAPYKIYLVMVSIDSVI